MGRAAAKKTGKKKIAIKGKPKVTAAQLKRKKGAAANKVAKPARRTKNVRRETTEDLMARRREFFAAVALKGYSATGRQIGASEAQQIVSAADHVIAVLDQDIGINLDAHVEAIANP